MSTQELLSDQRIRLIKTVRETLNGSPHSIAFAQRILGPVFLTEIVETTSYSAVTNADELKYGQLPSISALGFMLGANIQPFPDAEKHFLDNLERQRGRTRFNQLKPDDIALLGLADGLAHIKTKSNVIEEIKQWLISLIDEVDNNIDWTNRLRALAGDLLDNKGRLKVASYRLGLHSRALEIVLESVWKDFFREVQTNINRPQLLKEILLDPVQEDLDVAVVLLKALDLTVDFSVQELLPDLPATVQILQRTQHALKRWVCETKALRSNRSPIKWVIDNEYNVQSFLWAMLYPVYGDELVDETYLDNWGFVQARADIGILKLKLIIEVKFARSPGDFKEIEEQVAGDLGLYFKDETKFNRMIVYIYDDSDRPEPEKYDGVRNALCKRERIEDVIIVQRPSMLPNRGSR